MLNKSEGKIIPTNKLGRLLEDMDIFAVHLVFKHTLLPMIPDHIKQSPFSIVTALVDRIFLHGKLNFDQDIKMSGHVTWVGRSSAESTLVLEQQRDNGTWERVTDGRGPGRGSRTPLRILFNHHQYALKISINYPNPKS